MNMRSESHYSPLSRFFLADLWFTRQRTWSAYLLSVFILASVLALGTFLASAERALAQEPVPIETAVPEEQRHDLGDAPDSTNHHGKENMAYSGVPGRFPTVWEGDPPSGPLHRAIDIFWLGDRVSPEVEADLPPDADGVTNILNNGVDDVADRDRADDGWLNPDAAFANCEETEIVVRIRWNGPVRDLDYLWINAWYDGERDGDWDDVGLCEDDTQRSFEWIIQNFQINNPSFVGNFVDIPITTQRVHNPKGDGPSWLRLTLADRPVEQWDGDIPDGRGPPHPSYYRLGETEDYRTGKPQEPPEVTIRKTANVQEVQPGDEIEYTIVVANSGGSPALGVNVLDPIPAGTTYVPGSLNTSAPLGAYDAPNNWVRWNGDVPAGGSVTITFKVKVDDNAECGSIIYNRAAIITPNGEAIQAAEAKVRVVCPEPPQISLDKKVSAATVTPGGVLDYEIVVVNSSNVPAAGVTVVDPIPAGTMYVPGSLNATAPAASYNGGANRVEWTGTVPANGTVTIKFSVRVKAEIECPSVIINTAFARAPFLNQVLEASARTAVECPEEPKLDIVKRADVATTVHGGIISYEITVFNGGNAPAVGATMIDPIPAGTMYVAGSAAATDPAVGYDNINNWIKWSGTVPANGSVTVKFQVKVTADVECDSIIVNTATVRWQNQSAESSARTQVECPKEPDLTIRKTANVATVNPGGEIEYTIVIANTGGAPAIGVTMLDPIPAGTSYVAGSANATALAVGYDAGNDWVKWVGNIPANGSVTITFKVKVSDEVECQSTIFNRAAIVRPNDLAPIQQAVAEVRVDCPPQDLYMEFGDAPDSTFNHHGIDNTAYPGTGVLGRFPSVWSGTPAGEPSGPAHQVLTWYWLGDFATRERDADLLPDGDGVTNILNNGTADVANRDRADDGWLNRDAPFNNCETTRLKVRVARSAAAPQLEQLYLNVWFDGERDGDWDDTGRCAQDQRSFEWIVQNYAVNAATIPVNGFVDLDVPTELVHNVLAADDPDNAAWLRFSLTYRPAVEPPSGALSGALPDGRGPSYPGRFRLGETEDYLQKRDIPGEPKLEIRKKADVSRVQPGGMIEYKIEVSNSGTAAATGITVIDPIPAGTTYVAGSANATAPTVSYNNALNQIEWTGNIPAGGSVVITFKVQVDNNPELCDTVIRNVAWILLPTGQRIGSDVVLVEVECERQEEYRDLGDAPHSRSNHHAMVNTAYAGVPGRFPTVWETTPATEPSGPMHVRADLYWLGNKVTAEKDADLLPDMDGTTNILDNGAADVANRDRADDGWLNPDVPLEDCRRATLKVRVSRAAFPASLEKLYLNVWIDGNRDGDWADVAPCEFAAGALARSYEWIVQDFTIDPTTIPAGGFMDIPVPTEIIHNVETDDAWMRFTLSEKPAVRPALGGLADGRGPQQPASFRTGETEDYLRPGKPQGEPGKIGIDKTAQTASSPVALGDVIGYSVYLTHGGGTAPATTVMTDVLPSEVVLASPPVVTELSPSAAPLVATFDPSIGPNGAVLWSGSLSPGAAIRIDFRVRVRYCDDDKVIGNVAVAEQTDGSLIRASKDVELKCENPDPDIDLEKKILLRGENGELDVTEAAFLNTNHLLGFVLRLSSSDGISRTVVVEDDLPTGLIATGVSASSGNASILNAGKTVRWIGTLGPGTSPVTIRIRVRLDREVKCDERMINVATWTTRSSHSGESNRVTLWLACSDLGDAPDSTNHAGVGMTAYPGVKGQYPTVFDVAAPERGPMHVWQRPFFLGERVSAEVEADQGFDADGVNNLRPAADTPNLDRYDDGLNVVPGFNHCRLNRLSIQVNVTPAALTLLEDRKGYLNVWVDSNRDGDWADELDCPRTTGTPFTSALEHIVIDHPVDVAALGLGLHTIIVPTTGPVHFAPDNEQRSWLRISLSERPSNKPLTPSGAGHPANYGDGRGHDTPFRLGETEDYLIPGPTQQPQADVTVRKTGQIRAQYNPALNGRSYIATWIVNYRNVGAAAANNVTLKDVMTGPQSYLSQSANPPSTPAVNGNTLDYTLGTVNSSSGGVIIVRSTVAYTTPPGTIITNTATINASNDSDASNNQAVARLRVPLLPPVITYPLAGSTCDGEVTVTGKAQAGVEVDVYISGTLMGTATADANGDWSLDVSLTDGNYSVYAIAKFANGGSSQSSSPSPSVLFTVDSSLFWDPMSLRFVRPDGTILRPTGRLDETGWRIFLQPGVEYTVMLEICCDDPNAQVVLELGNQQIVLTDDDGDGVWSATFTAPPRTQLQGRIRICVTCDLIQKCSDGQVLIDPEGTVFDVLTGQPIDGATVACFAETGEAGGNGVFDLWPAVDFGQINPQTVGSDGYYSFFTPAGTYRVEVTKEGYQPHRSPDLVVTDTPVHYDVPLTPVIKGAAKHVIEVTDSGFVPAVLAVAPGDIIEWVNVGEGLHSTASNSAPTLNEAGAAQANAAQVNANAWDSGQLNTGDAYKRTLADEGTYEYRDGENPSFTATIIVEEGSSQPPDPTEKTLFLPVISRR